MAWTITEIHSGEAVNSRGRIASNDTSDSDPVLFNSWDAAVAFAGETELDGTEYTIVEVS